MVCFLLADIVGHGVRAHESQVGEEVEPGRHVDDAVELVNNEVEFALERPA